MRDVSQKQWLHDFFQCAQDRRVAWRQRLTRGTTSSAGRLQELPERLDRLIGEQRMSPVVVAFPDCFIRLGGNQYINSASMGAWEDFLLHQMLPGIEQRFGCGGEGHRGVFGESSGGYGALTHALRHADIWSASACHSGDMGFELCYLPDMPAVLRVLAAPETPSSAGGSNSRLLKNTQTVPSNALAMAASYDPDPTQYLGIRLPITFDTCEVIEERWANWLRQDPVVALESRRSNLRSLKALYSTAARRTSSICSTVPAGSCGG